MGKKTEREISGMGFGGKKSDEYESVNDIFRDGLADAYCVLTGNKNSCDEKALANIMAASKICEDLPPSELRDIIKTDIDRAANKMRNECKISK